MTKTGKRIGKLLLCLSFPVMAVFISLIVGGPVAHWAYEDMNSASYSEENPDSAYMDSCWNPIVEQYMDYPYEYLFGIPKGEEKYQDMPMKGHFFSTTRIDSLWIDNNINEMKRMFDRPYEIYLCSTNPACPRVTLANDANIHMDFELMWEGDLDGDGITDFGLYPTGRLNSQWNSYLIMTYHKGKLYELIDYSPSTNHAFRASGLEVAEPGSKPGHVKINCYGNWADETKEFPRKLVRFKPWT